MPRRKWTEIRDAAFNTPERRARLETEKRAFQSALALADLRESQGITQQSLAASLGTGQSNISRIEHEDDVYLSTLADYIAALGGRLEISAVFPDRTVRLIGPEPRGLDEAPIAASELPNR